MGGWDDGRDDFEDRDRPVTDNAALGETEENFEPNPFVDIANKISHAFGYEAVSDDEMPDGSPIVEDEALLEAAERAVAGIDPQDAYEQATEEWAELMGKRHLSGLFGDAGFTAALVTAPLASAGIPFAWDPYPPESMPAMRAGYGIFDRPFTLLVAESRLAEAREIMARAYPNLEL